MRPLIFQNSSSGVEEESLPQSQAASSAETAIPRDERLEITQLIHQNESYKTFLVRSASNMEPLNHQLIPLTNDLAGDNQSHMRLLNNSSDESKLKLVKIYDHANINSLRMLNNELAQMKVLGKHPGFVQCLGASINKDSTIISDGSNEIHEYEQGHSLLLFEYCPHGNLLQFLKNLKDGSSENVNIRTLFQQILASVNFLHTVLKMAHLSLRPTKILLDNSFKAKISDLSSARPIGNLTRELIRISQLESEKFYYASELIHPQLNLPLLGDKIDVFALGVMLFVTLFGEAPFRQANPTDPLFKYFCRNSLKETELFFRAHRATRKAQIDPDLKQLLCQMMQQDPHNRPSIEQILQNPWFNQGRVGKL